MKDISRLILTAHEIGLMGRLFHKNVGNSTECQTWRDVLESHKLKEEDVNMDVKSIAGMLFLLILGLTAGFFIFIVEHLVYWHTQSNNKVIDITEENLKKLKKNLKKGKEVWRLSIEKE